MLYTLGCKQSIQEKPIEQVTFEPTLPKYYYLQKIRWRQLYCRCKF